MKVSGKIVKFEDVQTGTSKAGKEWAKQTFIIDTGEEYNNIIAFEVFGEDKVDTLSKYNKPGDQVSVEFNIQCNEWKGRYFTSLQAWKIDKAAKESAPAETDWTQENEVEDNLPF